MTFSSFFDGLIYYNSNCSWFKIIVGPCDNTNSEDPIIKDYQYTYKPLDGWNNVKLWFDPS